MQATSQLTGFNEIGNLMHRIEATGNKFPRVRLSFGGIPLHLTVAGEKSKTPGAINLTDGGGYGHGRFFGRISTEGEFMPAKAARELAPEQKKAMWAILTRMRSGEALEVFAEHGREFGTCCMCGRELSNAESVEYGIGPECRKKLE